VAALETQSSTAFLCYPLGTRRGARFAELVRRGVRDAGFEPLDVSSLDATQGSIHLWISRAIAASRVVIADITEGRSTIMYQLGLASGLGKPTILMTERPSSVPAEFAAHPLIVYALSGTALEDKVLVRRIASVAEQATRGVLTPTDFDITPPQDHVIIEFRSTPPRADALLLVAEFAQAVRETLGSDVSRIRTGSPMIAWLGPASQAARIGRTIKERFSTKELRDAQALRERAEAERALAEADLNRAKADSVRHRIARDDNLAAIELLEQSLSTLERANELGIRLGAITIGGEVRIEPTDAGVIAITPPTPSELGTPADQVSPPGLAENEDQAPRG
jgi:hypothetical protein